MIETFSALEKYNYWQEDQQKELETGLPRDFYLDKLTKFLNNSLVKVLLGQRRTGKSYVLRQIMKYLCAEQDVVLKNIFYLNKENLAFDSISTYAELDSLFKAYQTKIKPKGKVYIFLDEVQEISGWEKFVNSYAQEGKNKYELFISGSNSKMLSGELATYLSGRYVTLEIMPFSYKEYLRYFNFSQNRQTYLNYLKKGGLPEIYHLEEALCQNYVSTLKDTIILKDIVARHKVRDVYLLESLFKYLVLNIGNLFSINSIVKYLNGQKIKTNHETLSNYLSFLKETYVIHEVEQYDLRGKSVLAGLKKFYLNDLAFKNYLTGSFDFQTGKLLENAVFLYYHRLGYKIWVGANYAGEVDFVLEDTSGKKYVQVAYSLEDKKVAEREFSSLLNIKDNYEKFIISLDDLSFGEREGIAHYSILNILKD